jgi:glycosyltransferase involved in cell wall biosynthesis
MGKHAAAATPQPATICYVITRLDVGGAQETVAHLTAGLDRTRFRPVVIAGGPSGFGGDLTNELRGAGVPVITEPSLVGPIAPFHDLRAVHRLTQLFRHLRPSVVHTHSSKAGALGRLAARRAGVAVVVHTVHGWSFRDLQPRPVRFAYERIERALARRTDAIVVVGHADRAAGLASGIGAYRQYRLIRSGVEIDKRPTALDRARARRLIGVADGVPVIGTVSRLQAPKDPLALVRAFAEVRAARPDACLVLVGDGPLRDEVAVLSSELGLSGSMKLVGVRRDVAALLRAFDVFVLMSRSEGLPRVVLEAQAAGVPVIATDVGSMRDVIRPGETGVLVAPGDHHGAAQAIDALLSDPAMAARLVADAYTRLGEFSVATMVEDAQQLYAELLRLPARGLSLARGA